MIQYPSIPTHTSRPGIWWVFSKIDGSNVRVEWHKKKGFHAFGKRHGILDKKTPYLYEAKDLILNNTELEKIFKSKGVESATAFFEFYGQNSMFGAHVEEPHTVSLIDVHIYKRGILMPDEFLDWFQDIEHAPLLHVGEIGQDLVQQIKEGTLPNMPFEGVVCKGKGKGAPEMFKIKSDAWYTALRDKCITSTSNIKEAEQMFASKS